MKNQIKTVLFPYLFIAYSFTWICWIGAFFLGYQDVPFTDIMAGEFGSPGTTAAFFLFRLGVYGPLIASLIITYITFKKKGLKILLARMIQWKAGITWYVYVLFVPVIINLAVVVIGLFLGIPLGDFFNGSIPLQYIGIFFLYQIVTSGLEEPGWRGLALQVLQDRYSAEKTSWILGLIWAIWHYPYVIFLYYQGGMVPAVFSLAGFTMAIIGQTFIFTWIYNNTKSVFLAVIFHAWLNTSTTFILGDIPITNPIMGIIPALVTWMIVLILLKTYGGDTLTGGRSSVP